jgi:hypothetical protein
MPLEVLPDAGLGIQFRRTAVHNFSGDGESARDRISVTIGSCYSDLRTADGSDVQNSELA